MKPSRNPVSRAERLYAFLVRLYPRSYRQEFGEEMQYVFAESLKDVCREKGRSGAARFWLRICLDAGKSLVVQHLESLSEGGEMNNDHPNFLIRNRNILLVALATGLLLLVPLVGMQVSDEVNWSPHDFAIAGLMLFGTGLAFELATRQKRGLAYRLGVSLALGTALFLLWANLAVGIVGSERNPFNWLYVGVLAVALAGFLIARFRPQGMQRALLAAGAAQAVVTVLAFAAGMHRAPESSGLMVLGVNGMFIALWVGTALLFKFVRLDGETRSRP
jgi:hypothetical protein